MKVTSFRSGVTLLELLIAVGIFAFLCGLLSGLLNVSLNLWRTGEKTGDIYDRYQVILEQLRKDFESIYAEKESYGSSSRGDYISNPEPSLFIARDKKGNYWCYLVRTPDDELYTLSSRRFVRVLYYLNLEGGTSSLVRTVISRDQVEKLWAQKQDTSGSTFPTPSERDTFYEGVLYLGIKVWDGIVQKDAWDSRSARRQNEFSSENVNGFEQCLPSAIEVELVLKPSVFPAPKIQLTSEISPSAMVLNVTTTQGLPDPPEYIKIGDEWIRFRRWGYKKIEVETRGTRGTRATSHPKGAEVIYGQTIKCLYYLPTTDNK